MIGTFDYQERISECAQWAEKAANDQAREIWKEMERFWRQRAICSYLKSETSLTTDISAGVSPSGASPSEASSTS
ncbi:MAG: hypothetical protein GEU95_11190 [Rhizobiales bacterium]|nr:hypothetical protein [Hyphomicrobiales bacterium]